MFSHWPQMIIPAYLLIAAIGTPSLRWVMIRRNGPKGFYPWSDFWKAWAVDAALKLVLVCVLFIGGFWH